MRHYLITLGIPFLLFALALYAETTSELAVSKAPVVNVGEIFGQL
ncbi:hypothetical protein [Pseudomonas knackmussii]|nr:hypothetical protein [Pseudomonas knackmussii]